MTAGARVRHLEKHQAELVAKYESEIAQLLRLNQKVQARKIKNRLRRLGRKVLRLPQRLTSIRRPIVADVLSLPPTIPIKPEPVGRVRAASGAWIYVDPSDGRGRSLIEAGGNFNPHTLTAWHQLLSEQAWTHVIDVGANYGEMLVNGGMPTGASLVAIEPNPEIRIHLERTLSEAGLPAEIMDVALSDVEGDAALLIDTNWSGTTRLSLPGDLNTLSVQTTTLDTILRSFDVAPSSMRIVVKVDVEGHEAAVLRGGLAMLSSLDDFAALVEILHVPCSDLAWMSEQFEISLLETDPNGKLVTAPLHALQDMLGSGQYYTQDAVFRRRPTPLN